MTRFMIVRSSEGAAVDGVSWAFKAIGSQTQGRFDFMVGPVGYLTGPPLHVHAVQDDTFFVLDGMLTIQVDDELFELGPGDFASVPPGVAHTFDNVHADRPTVRAVNLMTPGGLHDFFAERASLGEAEEPAALKRLAERYGMTTVGPPLRAKLGLG
ncbi:cupin domain-containing protein [Actinomadura soli]|uniref:Cupin domain-containing protein n=1 Tax=Actinomadura soli TaxID=2508997 RepID=A0A5C4JHQ4_9ACTN|nr:cupin domain-containing protein [Actinomadura soli]TMR05697.1 cupin domain-containing protein [Actinomadura soli]